MPNSQNADDKEISQVKEGMSGFRKALLFTAIPAILLSLISLAVPLVWIFAVVFVGLALLTALILLFTGDRETASGILTGVGIGIITLGGTCFANLGNLY